MKIISITDVHGEIDFTEQMEMFMRKADIILLSGDITHFGGRAEAERVIQSLRIYNKPVYAVAGNCDSKKVDGYLDELGINIHGRVIHKNGTGFAGIGFSQETSWKKYPGQFSARYFRSISGKVVSALSVDSDFILVSHSPPYNTKCDTIFDSCKNEIHGGNSVIREFIEKTQPSVCFCGHVHDAVGTDYIGRTLIINPGPAGRGNFAFLDMSQEVLKPLIIKGKSYN